MAILVLIFAVIVVAIILLTFRTSTSLQKSEDAIENLRRRIDS